MTPLESAIETYLVKRIKCIGGLCYKFSSSVNGVPDRIVIYNGQTYFIELKRPGGKPRKDQLKVHRDFKKQGVNVLVMDTKEQIDTFIRDTLKPPKKKEASSRTALAFDLSKI